MKPRNIAIFCDRLPPSGGGGVAVWVYELAKGLADIGYKVTVFTRDPNKDIRQIHQDEPYDVRIVRGRNWLRMKRLYSTLYAFFYLLSKRKPIIIASTWQFASGLAKLRKIFDFDLIIGAHSREIAKIGNGHSVTKARRSFESCNRIIAVSEFIAKMVTDRTGIDSEKVDIVFNGVDIDRFKPGEKSREILDRFQIEPSDKIILSVGRIVPIKRYEVIIEAFARLSEFENYVYIIVGDPSENRQYCEKLRELIKKYDLQQRILFAGFQEYGHLESYYQSADLFLQCSGQDPESGQQEGFSLTVLEATSSGLPSILTDSGGMVEAIENGKSGIIIEKDNVEALRQNLKSFLSGEEKWTKFGVVARKRTLEKFTWQKAIEKCNEIIESLR